MANNTSWEVEAERGHAGAVLSDKLLALAGRLAMLFNRVAELEEAVIALRLGLWACAAPVLHWSAQLLEGGEGRKRAGEGDARLNALGVELSDKLVVRNRGRSRCRGKRLDRHGATSGVADDEGAVAMAPGNFQFWSAEQRRMMPSARVGSGLAGRKTHGSECIGCRS